MKRINYLIIIIAAAALFNACDQDMLDTTPYDAINSENMWSTESLADLGVTGVYQSLRSDYIGLSTWYFDSWSFTGMEKDLSNLTRGTVISTDGFFSTYWKQGYEGIHRANDAILNLEQRAPLDSVKRGRLIAECKFLRAWFYYNLNQVYKGVPVYLEPINLDECTRGRETEAKVWETIISDLTDCINERDLPNIYIKGNANYGRATKAAALALRGKVYMWMKDYSKAEADLDTVGKLGPKLYTGNYKKLFKLENEQDPEMILSVQNIAEEGLGSSAHGNLAVPNSYPQGWNPNMPSPDFVESFEKADGSPFNWDDFLPGYSSMTPAQRAVFFLRNGLTTAEFNKLKNAGADMTKYLTTGNEERLRPAYENRDPRLATLVITPYSTYNGCVNGIANTYTLRWPWRTGSDNNPPFDLRTGSNSMFYYLWRKWVVEGIEIYPNKYVPIDQPLIRYADVVLLLAEAINEQGFSQKAVDLVNSVRTRAGHIALQTTDAGLPTYVSGQENLRDRIHNERCWELACEGVNLFDEMRWGTWKEKKFYPGNGIKQIWGTLTGAYSWKGDYLYKWAIPQTECEMNSNIVQNDGWIN